MKIDFTGQVALVTGAARGIGRAISQAFVASGARVALVDVLPEVEKTAADIGEGAAGYVADVTDPEAVKRLVDQVVDDHGSLDVLVNNAGITGFEDGLVPHDPENATLADWRAVHRVNLDGTFLGCRYAIRAMRPKGRGSIVNISSRSGLVGIAGAAAYAASKAAVRNHTKTVALWCAEAGLAIRCNSIHPAAILTPMWEPMLGTGPDREERMAAFVHDTPLRRFGRPEEVAAVALLLASDEAAYMTGAELSIDGGILAGSAAAPRT